MAARRRRQRGRRSALHSCRHEPHLEVTDRDPPYLPRVATGPRRGVPFNARLLWPLQIQAERGVRAGASRVEWREERYGCDDLFLMFC
jgi:hypothetical protein